MKRMFALIALLALVVAFTMPVTSAVASDKAKAGNPCGAKAMNPCNPGNPCDAKVGNPCNPGNPCDAKVGDPCNPCAPKASNPCDSSKKDK